MKLGWAAAFALALIAASPGVAQEAKGRHEILAQMPKELGGAPGVSVGDGMMLYPSAKPGRDPTIGVMIVKTEKVVDLAELRSSMRKGTPEGSVRGILREGTFTTANWPGAGTFFGEYATDIGISQNWALTTGKQNMLVSITALDKKSAKRAEAEVAEKIFGGAVISASKQAE